MDRPDPTPLVSRSAEYLLALRGTTWGIVRRITGQLKLAQLGLDDDSSTFHVKNLRRKQKHAANRLAKIEAALTVVKKPSVPTITSQEEVPQESLELLTSSTPELITSSTPESTTAIPRTKSHPTIKQIQIIKPRDITKPANKLGTSSKTQTKVIKTTDTEKPNLSVKVLPSRVELTPEPALKATKFKNAEIALIEKYKTRSKGKSIKFRPVKGIPGIVKRIDEVKIPNEDAYANLEDRYCKAITF